MVLSSLDFPSSVAFPNYQEVLVHAFPSIRTRVAPRVLEDYPLLLHPLSLSNIHIRYIPHENVVDIGRLYTYIYIYSYTIEPTYFWHNPICIFCFLSLFTDRPYAEAVVAGFICHHACRKVETTGIARIYFRDAIRPIASGTACTAQRTVIAIAR